jgi:hypothetical protein
MYTIHKIFNLQFLIFNQFTMFNKKFSNTKEVFAFENFDLKIH